MIEIGKIELEEGTVVRVTIDKYSGYDILSIRRWRYEGGECRPNKQGINLNVKHLPSLSKLVRLALRRARADGKLPSKAGRK